MTRPSKPQRRPLPSPGLAARLLAGLGVLLLVAVLARPGYLLLPDLAANQERAEELAGALDGSHTLDQTFTPARDGLCAVDVFALVPQGSLRAAYSVTLRLFDEAGRELGEGRFLLRDLQSQPRMRFTFPVQFASAGRHYRLRVESDAPPDTVSLRASRDEAYAGGMLFNDDEPSGRDLTLRAFAAPLPGVLWGLVAAALPDFFWLLALTGFLALIGLAFLALCNVWPETDGGLLAWLPGVGAAGTILSYAVLGRACLWALLAVMGLAALRVGATWYRRKQIPAALTFVRMKPGGAAAVLVVSLLVSSILLRLLQIQNVSVPLWVDGLTHAANAQRMIGAGRLPDGLLYHLGYHSLAVVAYDFAGRCLPEVLLLVGQWIAALSGVTVYPLARRILLDSGVDEQPARLGAGLAALLLSFLATFPAYLLNWGRYPFLLGLTLLPLALSAWMVALDGAALDSAPLSRAARLQRFALAGLLLAGMFLAHYGTLSLWLTFMMVWLAVARKNWLLQSMLRSSRKTIWVVGLGALGMAGLAALVVLLRFGPDAWEEVGGKLASTIAESRSNSSDLNYAEIVSLHLRGGGLALALAAGLGLAAAIARRSRQLIALTMGWVALQAVLITVQAPLLGYTLASYGNLLLALGLPTAVLGGGLLGSLAAGSETRRAAWGLGALLALAGALTQLNALNPATVLFGPADQQAMAWITENTPATARFLVNANRWGEAQTTASDGGGWLTTLTGRASIYPQEHLSADQWNDFVRRESVDYIYIGRFAGFVERPAFADYRRVYDAQGVTILQVKP